MITTTSAVKSITQGTPVRGPSVSCTSVNKLGGAGTPSAPLIKTDFDQGGLIRAGLDHIPHLWIS